MSNNFASSSITNHRQILVPESKPHRVPPLCDCGRPAYERTGWRPGNPGRRFYNCQNSLTSKKKCNFFLWLDDELEDDYYRKLILELKHALDMSVEMVEYNKSKVKVKELEFLLFKEKLEGERLEKLVEDARKEVESHRTEARWWKVAIGCLLFCLILVLVLPIFMFM